VNAFYRRSILVTSLTAVVLGVALVVVTASHGGGSFGYALGVLFVALGAGRLYLLRRR
jgi:hypothetical protein